jgi:CHAD domain-containing protein
MRASRKLARATGKVRDFDMVIAWTSQVAEGKDRRSFTSDLQRLRVATLHQALVESKRLRKTEMPSVDSEELDQSKGEQRVKSVEKRLAKRVDKEFEKFLPTQDVEVMHALRKDSKRLRHLLELTEKGEQPSLTARLRSIQDDLGAIRDHDLVIDYLRSRLRLRSTRSLIREEIAKRHARLEDFVTKNRGLGRLV